MEKQAITADHHTGNKPNLADQILILSYNSDVTNLNTKIQLRQNLFSFLLEGQKSVQYAESEVKISPDQFLLLSSGNCLMTEKTPATGTGGHYRSILLFFDNSILTDFLIRHPQKIDGLGKVKNEEAFLVFEKDPFLINFIESLTLMLASGHVLSANMRKVKLEELLLYLNDHYPEKIQRLRSFSYETGGDLLIRQAITGNIYNTITIEELAFICHMSVSTFKRHFSKIYGTSPNKWLLEKRMQRAAHLLKHSDRKASEIFYELGYENLSSFIHSFKQVHGITPKQYQLAD